MKRTRQKLALCTETVRILSTSNLIGAVGGTDSARCAMALDSHTSCENVALEALPAAPFAQPK
jgi:hypothetical protein